MFSVHTDFECSNLRDRAFKCQTPTVEMRMTMQQDQIFKQNFFLIASSSLYNSAVLFGFACRVSSSKDKTKVAKGCSVFSQILSVVT